MHIGGMQPNVYPHVPAAVLEEETHTWRVRADISVRSHLLLDVLELLLEFLYVSVDIGVVLVSLQGRDVSTGCLGTTMEEAC